MNKKKLILMFASIALIASSVLFGTLAYLTSQAEVVNTFTVGKVDITLDEAKVKDGKVIEKDSGTEIEMKDYLDQDGTIPSDAADVERVSDTNSYKLVPGKTYVKDPTVTVTADSEPAYVRMLVTITEIDTLDTIFDALHAAKDPNEEPMKLTDIFNGYDANVWKAADDGQRDRTTPGSITYEFRYQKVEDTNVINTVGGTGTDTPLPALFDSFTVPALLGTEQLKLLENMQIIVVGQAIQAEGFADETDADGNVTKTGEELAWAQFETQIKFDEAYQQQNGTTAP